MDKNLLKNIVIVAIFCLGLVAAFIGIKQAVIYFSKAGGTKGEPLSGVQITSLAEDRAILVWQTSESVLSLVNYGTSSDNLSQSEAETTGASQHQVLLTDLLPDTLYYFKIQVGKNIFDQNGTPYSFTTLASSSGPSFEAPTPTLAAEPLATITEEKIKKALGTKDPQYDLNQDGIVNLLDLFLFQKQNQ